ncbi:MAG: helix-turn-helix domain-containing protein [Oscillibacter sp.]|nr:helix-turn-helix domain-containing protein [Oscillibacter sp.]
MRGGDGREPDGFHPEGKTEEAKRLLRYSDKSLTAIGSYLGFSSASHFSRVFKVCVGSTRSEYRDKYL